MGKNLNNTLKGQSNELEKISLLSHRKLSVLEFSVSLIKYYLVLREHLQIQIQIQT